MSHTPGPWINDRSHPEWERNVVWSGDMVVARVVDDQHANADANARLIAAAPELLEVCRKLLAWQSEDDPYACDDWMEFAADLGAMAGHAIAKAEGVATEGTNGKERSLD